LPADLHSLGAHAALRNPASEGDKISANSGIGSATLRLMATRQREELGKFLRARRAALKPELVSMPAGRRRRTPGLRREEVAQLADVGVTWYTWLEQGRDIHVSRQTVERIAHALRLTASDRAYLFNLLEPAREQLSQRVDAPIQSVLDALASPAEVVNARWDVLAFNQLADEIFKFDHYRGRFARNLIWRGFVDPARRALYVDWEKDLGVLVRFLRAQYASHLDDASFEELVSALCKASPEFVRMWDAQSTQPVSLLYTIRLTAPRLGALTVQSTRFFLADRPGDMLLVLLPADPQTAAILAKEGRRLTRRAGRLLEGTAAENGANAEGTAADNGAKVPCAFGRSRTT